MERRGKRGIYRGAEGGREKAVVVSRRHVGIRMREQPDTWRDVKWRGYVRAYVSCFGRGCDVAKWVGYLGIRAVLAVWFGSPLFVVPLFGSCADT